MSPSMNSPIRSPDIPITTSWIRSHIFRVHPKGGTKPNGDLECSKEADEGLGMGVGGPGQGVGEGGEGLGGGRLAEGPAEAHEDGEEAGGLSGGAGLAQAEGGVQEPHDPGERLLGEGREGVAAPGRPRQRLQDEAARSGEAQGRAKGWEGRGRNRRRRAALLTVSWAA